MFFFIIVSFKNFCLLYIYIILLYICFAIFPCFNSFVSIIVFIISLFLLCFGLCLFHVFMFSFLFVWMQVRSLKKNKQTSFFFKYGFFCFGVCVLFLFFLIFFFQNYHIIFLFFHYFITILIFIH